MPDRAASDVLVVGAGPAGIAAACAASEAAARVAVVDDNPSAGGQIWRGDTSRQAARWLQRFADAGVELLAETQVIDRPQDNLLLARRGDHAIELGYDKLVLATGARERFLPFPGWTLPNVVGAGGLQALVKCGLPVEGRRVVVAGAGPLLLAVAAYLRERGAIVPLVAEQATRSSLVRFGFALTRAGKLIEAAQLKWRLRAVRYAAGCWPVSAHGNGKVDEVVLRRGDREWRERCDYLACGFGLAPNLELASLLGCVIRNGCVAVNEWQETSVRGVYCAGEPTGIGGVDLALAGGRIAGYAAVGRVDQARKWFGARERALQFKEALDRTFRLRDELKAVAEPRTIVCRCEDVTLASIQAHPSWRAAKLQTRCGMGPCQGRVCGPALEFLLGWQPESVRPPIFPAPVRDLCTHDNGLI